MDKKELIKSIVAKEWPMFHNVNGDERVDCQEDPTTFENMRTAQFSVWDEASLKSHSLRPQPRKGKVHLDDGAHGQGSLPGI